MLRYGNGSVPIATGWKYTNCHRTHRSSIPRSGSGNTRARPELTTGTSRPPRNWPVPCPESLERCKIILSRSDPICFLFADRNVPLIMRGCICLWRRNQGAAQRVHEIAELVVVLVLATVRELRNAPPILARRNEIAPLERLA